MDALKRDEPVAWMVYTLDGQSVCVTDNPADFGEQHRALPLYTHPPRREQDDAETTALRAEVERLREALEDVIDPISKMERELKDGYNLDGAMAVSLSRDPEYLRSIARAALKETNE